jgi:protein gp37
VSNRETIIAWTDRTWNVVTGCSRVSSGCLHCYAERISLKFGRSTLPWTARNVEANVVLHPDRMNYPYKWREPAMVFVNSMSDMFHDQIPDDYLRQTFDVMSDPRNWHLTFQILTKRPERAAAWPGPWTPNIWMGVSVEDAKNLWRMDVLRNCKAHTKWISFEPLIAPVTGMNLSGYSWAVVGGESGPGYRPMDHAWAREIRDECLRTKTAYFFKQSAAFMRMVRPGDGLNTPMTLCLRSWSRTLSGKRRPGSTRNYGCSHEPGARPDR